MRGLRAMMLAALALLCSFTFAWAQEPVVLRVGHVGHDHQIALYAAAQEGKALEARSGVWLKELKPQEVYELYEDGKLVAQVQMVLVGGGAKMPAALEQGDIEVGLGGLGPVAKFIDKGTKLKVIAPLNNDGDALVVRKGFPSGGWAEVVKAIKTSDKPMRIGFKDPMANAFMILTKALDTEGISYGIESVGKDGKPVQVLLVNLQDLQNALPSLEAGIVDGVVVNEPMGTQLELKGVGKIAADLSDLPPAGKWEGHPCCVVAATEAALSQKRAAIRALLKAIAAGGQIVISDKAKALAAEGAWTKTPSEVGRKSIENVDYVVAPDAQWLEGVKTWIALMQDAGHFNKLLKDKTPQQVLDAVLDLAPSNEALEGMKK